MREKLTHPLRELPYLKQLSSLGASDANQFPSSGGIDASDSKATLSMEFPSSLLSSDSSGSSISLYYSPSCSLPRDHFTLPTATISLSIT